MDVPHGVLTKLSDVDTINKTNELDVVIVWAGHNEFLCITVFSVSDLNDVDAVYDSAMYLNKPNLMNFVWGKINSEFMFC